MQRAAWIIATSWAVCACVGDPGGGYYKRDGPPRHDEAKLSGVRDAVPRKERLTETGNDPYSVNGKTYHPLKHAPGYRQRGVASWYGRMFHGRRTSSGERYDMYAMTAAHRTLPLPSYVKVRNLENGREVTVRVNDRGPFLHNRLIDLSYVAAHRLGIVGSGTGLVEVSAVMPGAVKKTPQPRSIAVGNVPASPPVIYIQVGAFTQRHNAESMRHRLQDHAHGPVVLQHARMHRRNIYRVRVGPIASVDLADEIVVRMQRQGYDPRLIIE